MHENVHCFGNTYLETGVHRTALGDVELAPIRLLYREGGHKTGRLQAADKLKRHEIYERGSNSRLGRE